MFRRKGGGGSKVFLNNVKKGIIGILGSYEYAQCTFCLFKILYKKACSIFLLPPLYWRHGLKDWWQEGGSEAITGGGQMFPESQSC